MQQATKWRPDLKSTVGWWTTVYKDKYTIHLAVCYIRTIEFLLSDHYIAILGCQGLAPKAEI